MKQFILFLILFSTVLYSQQDPSGIWWFNPIFGGVSYTHSWSPQNVRTDSGVTTATFIGSSLRTKVAKTEGGILFRPYMRMGTNPATWDSVYGYTYTIARPCTSTKYYYSQAGSWKQGDKDIVWVKSSTSSITITPYLDSIPDQFYFTDYSNADSLTEYRDTIQVLGMGICDIAANTPVTYAAGEWFTVWSGSGPVIFSRNPQPIKNGQYIVVKILSGSAGSVSNTTVTIGNTIFDTFTVSVREAQIPEHYYITDKRGGEILQKGRQYAIKFKD